MTARLAVLAALAGSAAGAAVVFADEPAPRPNVPAVKAATPTPQPTPEPIEARDARIVFETADPRGGPAWAMREFATTFKTRKGEPRPASCYEVGRLNGNAFGWIKADGAFKSTQPGRGQHPMDCPSRSVLDAIEAVVYRFATVTHPPGGSPQPDRTVTWGVAQPHVTKVMLPNEPPIAVSRVFLKVGTGEVPPAPTEREIERADGTRKRFDELKGRPGERPVPGSGELAAIAPDPAGGRPWGLVVARGERGSTCSQAPEQLVGHDHAHLDSHLDIAYASPFAGFADCERKPPTRGFPMRLDTLVSGTETEPQGRIERRVLEGRIVFFGTVHPDVATVTITTPHDVRTLVPTPPHHAIVAVYAGLFPGGNAIATARFKDGRAVTRTLHVE